MSSLPRATSPSAPFPAVARDHPRAAGAAAIQPGSPSVPSKSPSSPPRTASSASSSSHADTDPLAFVSGRPDDLPDLEPGELPRQRPHTRPADTLTDKLLLALSSGTFTLGQIAAQNNITITQLIKITSDPEFQDQLEAFRRLTHQQTTLTATTYMPRGVQILAQLIHGAELDIDEMRSRARDLIYDKPELFCRWSDTIRKVVHLLARLTKPPTPTRERAPRAVDDRASETPSQAGGREGVGSGRIESRYASEFTTGGRNERSAFFNLTGSGTGVSPVQSDFAPFTSLFNTPTRAHSSSHEAPFDIPQVVRESSIPLHTSRDDRFSEIDATLAALESALNTVASTPSRCHDTSESPVARATDLGPAEVNAPTNAAPPLHAVGVDFSSPGWRWGGEATAGVESEIDMDPVGVLVGPDSTNDSTQHAPAPTPPLPRPALARGVPSTAARDLSNPLAPLRDAWTQHTTPTGGAAPPSRRPPGYSPPSLRGEDTG